MCQLADWCACPSPRARVHPPPLQRTLYGLVGLGSVSDYVTKNSQTNVVRGGRTCRLAGV